MLAQNHALIALGANLPFGDFSPDETIILAMNHLKRLGCRIISKSRLYTTPAFPKGNGSDYVNAAVAIEVPHATKASALLSQLHQVEIAFGRERHRRWAGRTLDLDLLAMGDFVLPDALGQTHWRNLSPEAQMQLAPPTLILPHPRLQDRAFVLVPLAEIAPDWVHPLLQSSVQEMLNALPEQDRAEVLPF